ncbi:MAG: hypothetical protein ACR2L2_05430 [Acidobacteriota bacterium]
MGIKETHRHCTTMLICFHFYEAVFAGGAKVGQDVPADVVKNTIASLGVGEHARATITLRSGHKIKGYITQIAADTFEISDPKGGGSSSIAYSDVSKVRKGTGLSRATKILIGVGTAVAIAFVATGVYVDD